MRPAALVALLTCLAIIGCGGGEDDMSGTSSGPAATVRPEPALGLKPTLATMRRGRSEQWCDFMTARFIYFNWSGEPGRLGIKRCRYYSSRGDQSEAGGEVDIEIFKRSSRRAVVRASTEGFGLYFGLLYDGHRWLIDGYADRLGDRLQSLFQPRPRAVTEGVSADELESIVKDAVPQPLEIACAEVPNEDLGDWACELAMGDEPDVKRGTTIYSVDPNGTVSGSNAGGPAAGIEACCIDLSD